MNSDKPQLEKEGDNKTQAKRGFVLFGSGGNMKTTIYAIIPAKKIAGRRARKWMDWSIRITSPKTSKAMSCSGTATMCGIMSRFVVFQNFQVFAWLPACLDDCVCVLGAPGLLGKIWKTRCVRQLRALRASQRHRT